ncbi:phosphatidic acid phosphatase [Actinorhabdospora filicis]|uniref:Phosphatidic acid phosphatase n=1 Tax=Actinorhabdospora filicis TaxID=1785913 RepID=A0A9W6SKN7_9ACTN|nr:phosphatase PAP2 family protein [Actinorhabdospora filicis]GLZ78764.1 phosphatidic acid phosphatase [Actinorhabdospora filicis]
MTSADNAQTASPTGRRRLLGVLAWIAAFVAYSFTLGLPTTDPVLAFLWFWALTIAWNNHYPLKRHWEFLRDWLPIIILLEIYNISRGFADQGFTPHAVDLIAADTAMFAGNVPTVWLQAHLYNPDHVQWWDVMVSVVYFSHFVAALLVAVILWLRNRVEWGRFIRRWFFLTFFGLATYFLYPAAPPWWASKYGMIDPVARISTRGWDLIGLHGAGNMLNKAQIGLSNPVAAMPSLHTAFALLVVAFFFPKVRKYWIPILCLYPLAMTFTLVYSAEHWIIDVLVGWVYVAITFIVVGLAEKAWAAYRRKRRPTTTPPQQADRQEEEAQEPAAPNAGSDPAPALGPH